MPLAIYLTCLVLTTSAQKAASTPGQKATAIIDKIRQSLPQSEAGWKLAATDSYRRADGSVQANLHWTNGSREKGATVIVHRTLKQAKREFRPSGKEDVQEGFRIDAVGDEAFLWPPEAPRDGAYNIRFRKARVEVWMSGPTEEEVKRYARIIAAAITPAT